MNEQELEGDTEEHWMDVEKTQAEAEDRETKATTVAGRRIYGAFAKQQTLQAITGWDQESNFKTHSTIRIEFNIEAWTERKGYRKLPKRLPTPNNET